MDTRERKKGEGSWKAQKPEAGRKMATQRRRGGEKGSLEATVRGVVTKKLLAGRWTLTLPALFLDWLPGSRLSGAVGVGSRATENAGELGDPGAAVLESSTSDDKGPASIRRTPPCACTEEVRGGVQMTAMNFAAREHYYTCPTLHPLPRTAALSIPRRTRQAQRCLCKAGQGSRGSAPVLHVRLTDSALVRTRTIHVVRRVQGSP
ncbi:hypothetical protein CC78DRAFT_577681 [Lojkania enalia]|uniref:Uncharacterized protein n=1 Tax=Lojkania enalia TaxID=147567 RepID=A0A9P4N225_9PLEO|nr:hypothetical protein CC78DRAFT_577681 [Didymosphaeria enalia]